MSNYISLVFLFLTFLTKILAQEKGDVDYVFTNLQEASKAPLQVYHLDLSKQKLKEFPIVIFSFSNLKTLDLSKNKISFLPAEIENLELLVELDLSNNKIGVLPPQIGKLEFLEKLYLEKNELRALPAEIGELQNLINLNLWSNELKKVPREIENLRKLEVLNLRGMIFDQIEIDKLDQLLPETKIFYPANCNCGP
tara:strand:- start:8952 stop:9539 length:588 start_codon:yes stop_codon:yes gene_type:complete